MSMIELLILSSRYVVLVYGSIRGMSLEYSPKVESRETEEEIYISQEEFNRQFTIEHTLSIGESEVTYSSVAPSETISDDWVVYVGGFSQGKDSYLAELYNLAQSGRKVVFTNPLKGIQEHDFVDALEGYNLPDTIPAKALAVKAVIDHLGGETVDLVGHSQGAAVLTALATMEPELAHNLVLECPSGLQGEDSTGRIIKRFALDKALQVKEMGREVLRGDFSSLEAAKRASESFASEIQKDPIWRLNVEIPGAATVNIVPMLEFIHQQTIEDRHFSTKVTLINAQSDIVFPPDQIEDALEGDPLNFVDSWAMYARKSASHTAPALEKAGLLRQLVNKDIPANEGTDTEVA